MIWFNSKLNVNKGWQLALDQSVALTKEVKSILKTDTVQITGFAEIGDNIEKEYTVDEEFWEAFANWETSLKRRATKDSIPFTVDTGMPTAPYELTVFTLKNGQKIIKISHDGPVWYVRAA